VSTERDVIEVTRRVPMAVLLGRGVGRVVRSRVTGGPAALHLPDVELVTRGIRPDAERLTAYQELVGEPVNDALPAGFLHVLGFPLGIAMMARPDFPLPALGMVHVSNRVEQHRAVVLGEVLEVRLRVERLAAHRKGTTADFVAEVTVGGSVVWRGVSTYLARGVRHPDAVPDETERREFTPPGPTAKWRVGRDVGRRYADVSGDRNPIHTSRLGARAFGFPRPIAHGMYTAARALAGVGPAARGAAYRWEVEFATPVLLPSTVGVRVTPDDAGGWALAAWSRSSKPHLTGTVRPT
jgi:acyl dehydratase